MLHIHHSNSITVLADQLIDRLAACQDDPLAARTVVVPHPEMGRWLARRMANRAGICANIKFELPAACLWRLIARRNPKMPAQNPLNPDVLTLRLLAAFNQQPPSPLQKYLQGKDLITALSMARQLARLFDQYLIYRHQWILDWESGGGSSWQAALWRQLSPVNSWHWANALSWLFESGHQRERDVDQSQSLEVMAVPSLPPDFVRAFAALAQTAEINCYNWSPCAEYWGDIADRKQSATTPTEHLEIGNSLLGSLGCQLRDFTDLLLEYESSGSEHYQYPDTEGCLAGLQSEILKLAAPSTTQAVKLDSIRIQACHSRRREVEVCHDLLLDLIEKNPDVKPHQIQVLAPDISEYAADIESVFGAAAVVRLPFRIIGPRKQPAGAASTCLELLKALNQPIDNRGLLALLAGNSLARRFRIDATGCELISTWIAAAGAYGESDPDNPVGGKFGWDAAARRLLLDSMLEDSGWQPDPLRAAGPVGSSDLDLLGAFLELVDALTSAQKAAQTQRSLERWCAWTHHILSRFLHLDAQGEYEKQMVSTAVERLRNRVLLAGYGDLVELRLFLHLLEPEVAALSVSSQGVQGGITFASASSQRLIPAQVVYAMGLNDGEFPAAEAISELDLIARSPQRGDGSRRQDDRQILLEWLCNTRQMLLLSYVGRDIRDNSERTASPLVGELLDYLGWGGRVVADSPTGVLQHPAQPFSRRYGRCEELFTYKSNFMVDSAYKSGPNFLELPLPDVDSKDMTLSELTGFLQNPAKQFLGQRLGAWFSSEREPMEALAPTTVNNLDAFNLKQAMIGQHLAGWAVPDNKTWALIDVAVPDTPVGAAAVEAMFSVSSATAESVRRLIAEVMPRRIQGVLPLDGMDLSGQVDEVYKQTRVVFRAGKSNAKVLLKLWVEHLFCNALETPGGGITSIMVCEDKPLELSPPSNAAKHLKTLVALYLGAQSRPLPLIAETSMTYANRIDKGEQVALKFATGTLLGSEYRRGDAAEVHVQRMLQAGFELDHAFQETALLVWQPLLEHLQ